MAHSSWFTYAGMTRIYKHHEFALRHPAVRMQKASFSSYGGELSLHPKRDATPSPTPNPETKLHLSLVPTLSLKNKLIYTILLLKASCSNRAIGASNHLQACANIP